VYVYRLFWVNLVAFRSKSYTNATLVTIFITRQLTQASADLKFMKWRSIISVQRCDIRKPEGCIEWLEATGQGNVLLPDSSVDSTMLWSILRLYVCFSCSLHVIYHIQIPRDISFTIYLMSYQ
jgi:hypothetical protein